MQAARGASLSSSADAEDPTRSPRHRLLFLTVFLLAYAVDVVSKVVAVRRLDGEPDVPVIGELLQLRLVRNPGASFGMGATLTEAITVLAIAACVVVVWVSRRLGSTAWSVALGLLLAGIAGNLTDRLLREPGPLRGHVIDFFMLPHWPVFNVADMCINAGAILVLILTLRGVQLDGSRASQ